MIAKTILNPDQLAICASIAAAFQKQARLVPFIKLTAVIQAILLLAVICFEVGLFLSIANFINEGNEAEDQIFSNFAFAIIGFITLMALHILSIKNRDSRVVKYIERIASVFLLIFIFGAGFCFSAGLFESLMALFERSDPEAPPPVLPAFFEEYILPNLVIFIAVGLGGFTAICLFSANFLFERLSANIEKILELLSNKKAAQGFMKIIKNLQKKQLILYAQSQHILTDIGRMAEKDALKIALEIAKAVGLLDGLIMEKELFPDELNQEDQNELAAFFNSDSPETKAIKNMPLNVLKSYREKFTALDEKAILDILKNG